MGLSTFPQTAFMWCNSPLACSFLFCFTKIQTCDPLDFKKEEQASLIRTAAAVTLCAMLSFKGMNSILFTIRNKSGQLNTGSPTLSCEKTEVLLPAGHMTANTDGFVKTTRQQEGLSLTPDNP